ncbi:MAG: tRNA (adenosine(37)-N6)-threonylcarbamoyltransferase complex transferase subunit TsaD [Phycisphaerales bacterium]
MRILGIESSCDETAAAVVEDGWRVRSNVIASQHELHAEYAGVVPEIASRAHVQKLLPTIRAALSEAGATLDSIDAIAVGNRPGLIGALLVGVAASKALAWSLGIPIIGIDHVEAHLHAAMLDDPDAPDRDLPALGLVVSGGHTSLYLVQRDDRAITRLERLGRTIDDAVGEAYDKAAAMLGLPHPGGPKIDVMAQLGDEHAHDLPISRLAPDSLDFSFSGLKTALLYAIRGTPGPGGVFERDATDLTEAQRRDLAASFQRAAVRALILKTERALDALDDRRQPINAILIGGGVSANSRLRHDIAAMAAARGIPARLPKMPYCMDNAAMIAGLAHARLMANDHDDIARLRAVPTTGG